MLSNAAKPSGHLSLVENVEPKPLVVRGVPRDVGVGGQRQRCEVVLPGPRGGGVQQRAPKALSRMSGVHGDLLNVGVAVDDVSEQVGDRPIRFVCDDPGTPVLLKDGQGGDKHGFIVCDGMHTQFSERRAGGPLRLAKRREVMEASRSDHADLLHAPR
jgi:hypothetical protein